MSATRDFRLGRPLDRARLERALALEDPDRRMLLPMRPSRLGRQSPSLLQRRLRASGVALHHDLRRHVIDRGEDSHLPIVDADLSMVERDSAGTCRRALEIANEGCEIAQMLGSDTAQRRHALRAQLRPRDAGR